MRLIFLTWAFLSCLVHGTLSNAGELQIHYINVGQGGATLIIGPNGRAILYDFGKLGGNARLVPYLEQLPNFSEEKVIDYAIVSHADVDHFNGYADLVDPDRGGFDVRIANWEPGTNKREGLFKKRALQPALNYTSAGSFEEITVGHPISLGDGARALVVAANGEVWGEDPRVRASGQKRRRVNENDRSIALFVTYGEFRYLIDGDLGAGPERCTNHVTNQANIQARVARALLRNGLITAERGVDVLHIAHHGSESSTSAEYYNIMKPRVGVISVGPNQGDFRHPRKAVVENVLTCPTSNGQFSKNACSENDTRPSCVRAPPLEGLYQTDIGSEEACDDGMHCVSFLARPGGDIVITTDGRAGYRVEATSHPFNEARPLHVEESVNAFFNFEWPPSGWERKK